MFEKLTSRKFLATVAGTLFVLFGEQIGIPQDSIQWLVGLIASYIVGESAVDIARTKTK